ncbi:MAG: hypothetical protein V3T31_05355, partial [candidate division Zixibacteria bacterium]
WDPYYTGEHYDTTVVDTATIAGAPWDSYHRGSLSGNSFLLRHQYQHQHYLGFIDSAFSDIRVYRKSGLDFKGKAEISVVSSVELYTHSGDTNPRVQQYTYNGGLLDASATTPRFCEARVSTPFFLDDESPEGWSVQYFYNGVDSTSFYDLSLLGEMPIPLDLADSTLYGTAGGGFRLNGQQYLFYTFSVGDDEDMTQDTVCNYYSVYLVETLSGTSLDIFLYRPRLDSTHSVVDSIASDVSYVYDLQTGQVVETRARHRTTTDSTYYYVDVATLAYTDPLSTISDSLADNALVQVSQQARYYISDSAGINFDTTLLSMSRSDYVKLGAWKPVRSFTWRDLATRLDTLFSVDTLPGSDTSWHNQYGNIVASVNGTGVTSCTKLNPDGTQPIVAVVNAHPHECSFFNAEFGFDGDTLTFNGWRNVDTTASYPTTAESFTGDKSFVIETPPEAETAYGLKRTILADSLASSQYTVSYWIKAVCEHLAFAGLYAGDSVAQEFNGDLDLTQDGTWQRREFLIDIDTTISADSLVIGFALYHYGSHTPGSSNYFDDIRFNPIDAKVSTMVYDSISGVVTADAANSNIPTKYSYDKFYRRNETRNFQDDLLNRSSVHLFGWSSLFDPQNPHYTKTTTYLSSGDSTSSIAFYNSLGQMVQSRTQLNDSTSSVSATDYDISGRVLKQFKPYENIYRLDTNHLDWGYWEENSDDGSAENRDVDTIVIIPEPLTDSVYWKLWLSSVGDTTEGHGYVLKNADTMAMLYASAPELGSDPCFWFDNADSGSFVASEDDTIRVILDNRLTPPACRTSYVNALLAVHYHTIDSTPSYMDYDYSSYAAEAGDYYSDTGNGVDCGGYPYSENAYSTGVKPKLDSTGAPGAEWSIDSEHATHYFRYTDTANKVYVSKTIDPDDLESRVESDHFGRFEKKLSVYDVGKTLATITYKDDYGRDTAVFIDTLVESGPVTPIRLRAYEYNDLGQQTKEWRIDYGSIRMVYNKAGNLRFMQNDKRVSENTSVYYKYDILGRKIEEGLLTDAANDTSHANADDMEFPQAADSPEVAYRWYYDHYEGNDTITSPGALVR